VAEALLPTLTVVGGPFDGAKIVVEGRTEKVLGSGPSSNLKLELENIDSMHALLSIDERGLVLSDMGSSTGCFVNGERVESDAVLAEGDRVFLGPPGSSQSVKLVVSVGDVAAAAAAPVFEEEEPPGAEVSVLGASGPTLMVMGGDLDGTTFAIDGSQELLLGSGSGCNGRLAAENVAAQHARVVWQSGGIVIADLETARGTFVNGEKVVGSRVLMDGDRICLGPPGSMQSVKLLATVPLGVVAPFEAPAPAFAGPTSDAVGLEPMPESAGDLGFGAPPRPAAAPPAPPPAPASPPAFGDSDAIVLDLSETGPPGAQADALPFDFSSPAPSVAPTVPEPFLATEPFQPIVPPGPVASAHPPLPAAASPAPKVVESIPLKPLEMIQPPPRREAPADRGFDVLRTAPRPSAMTAARPRARARSARIPRLVWVALAAAALGGGGVALYARLHKTPPVISALQPTKAEPGQTISIAGTDLATSAEGNIVRFNGQPGEVTSAAAEQLSVTVPEMPLGNASVTVEARGARSNALFLKVAPVPRISAIEPDVALPEQTVAIKGSRLAGANVLVTVAGIPALVLDSRPDQLTIRIPALTFQEGSPAPVRVQVGDEPAAPGKLILGRLPLVTQVQPTQAAAGERVTIRGRGFAAAPKDSHVRFGASPALVVEAQPTQLIVAAPSSASPYGQVDAPVVVEVGGSESRPAGFSLLRESGGLFVPRFFAAPVAGHSEHDHALVSFELGPFLVLSDKAEAASTAARAVAVADALNKLFQRAAQGAVTVEVRESPRLSIVASGDPAPLCVVTAADAAGYGEPWATGGRSASISARELARFWAAMIDDFLMLFVRHDRPTRLVELSPRAKVLLDLSATAQRRSGPGGGVPAGVVLPLSTVTAESFRTLALVVPQGGVSSRSTIAIEGLWQGSLTESERPRGIQIEMRAAGGRLGGSCTIKEGKLPVVVTLGDVSFSGGQLRFSLAIRGSVLFFKGQLQGVEIQGTIHKRADDPASVGQFQLKYVQ
jgi:hypothetical protein